MILKKVPILLLLLFVSALTMLFAGASWASYTKADNAIERIGPEDAHKMVAAGEALLVCAYADDNCKSNMLHGALFRSELEARLSSLPKDQKIIFYCGWPGEGTSASLAVTYQNKGYTHVMALKGGIKAWTAKGLPMKAAH